MEGNFHNNGEPVLSSEEQKKVQGANESEAVLKEKVNNLLNQRNDKSLLSMTAEQRKQKLEEIGREINDVILRSSQKN